MVGRKDYHYHFHYPGWLFRGWGDLRMEGHVAPNCFAVPICKPQTISIIIKLWHMGREIWFGKHFSRPTLCYIIFTARSLPDSQTHYGSGSARTAFHRPTQAASAPLRRTGRIKAIFLKSLRKYTRLKVFYRQFQTEEGGRTKHCLFDILMLFLMSSGSTMDHLGWRELVMWPGGQVTWWASHSVMKRLDGHVWKTTSADQKKVRGRS